MTGAGETYFSAFAVLLKATPGQIGLLAALPQLVASLAQLFSAWLGQRLQRRMPIILFGASLQCFSWVPLILLPLLYPDYAVIALIAAVMLYYFGSNMAVPQWSSLMGDLVHKRRRGRGARTRNSGAGFSAENQRGALREGPARQRAGLPRGEFQRLAGLLLRSRRQPQKVGTEMSRAII